MGKQQPPRSGRKRKTAGELMSHFEPSTEFAERIREQRRQGDVYRLEYDHAVQPVLDALRGHGVRVNSLDELARGRHRSAVSVLMEWLPRTSDPQVKRELVRALSVPWAREAGPLLIREFRSALADDANQLRWAIANGIELIASDDLSDDLFALVRDKQFGTARQMLVLALGKMHGSRVITVLTELLSDEDVAGHAVIALGKVGNTSCRSQIEPFLRHSTAWVRKEAGRALKRIQQRESADEPGVPKH